MIVMFEDIYTFFQDSLIESLKEQRLFEKYFCNNVLVFTVTFVEFKGKISMNNEICQLI